ncbi:MAG: GntR family transcriptional regulator [Proteobacteria bacterium]|nr:GntR family transcriptional regulator [Pseudomonadota bacterium]
MPSDDPTGPGRPLARIGDSAERVYRGLRQAIIEQALAPGAKLPEDAVAARFGVSRTVVRAALERLSAEGLVDRPVNRSARVASIGVEEAADLVALRQQIETLVMQRLAGRLAPADLGDLRAHVRREEQASSLNQPEAVRLSGDFHVRLAEATGSPLLTRYVSDLVSRASLILAGHALPHSSSCAVHDHDRLLDLLEAGDTAAAQDFMRAHLDRIAGHARLLRPRAGGLRDLP